MLQQMGRRLRLVIDGTGASEPTTTSAEPVRATVILGPLVDFVAYADACTLSGQIRLGGERLSDLLNTRETWELVDVMAESFDGSQLVESREISISRDEIIVVHAAGPRGNQERRHRTNLHPVSLRAGQLRIRGYLHARPGLDPLAVIERSMPMLPLTDASIEYVHHGLLERRKVGTIVVNRDRIDAIARVREEEVALPDAVLSTIG